MEQKNKIIAEWVGYEKRYVKENNDHVYLINILNEERFYHVRDMQFHKSYDWIIPVCKEIVSVCTDVEDIKNIIAKLEFAMMNPTEMKLFNIVIEYIEKPLK